MSVDVPLSGTPSPASGDFRNSLFAEHRLSRGTVQANQDDIDRTHDALDASVAKYERNFVSDFSRKISRSGGGGYKNSMGIEALAIFALATFLVRIVADAIQRAQGRSFGFFSAGEYTFNDFSSTVLTLLDSGSRLYGNIKDDYFK
ncbi:hypothetical protein SK128_003051 [Halocaridina rubra]|uniref:Uncharacterized protein n=1 Tax=Halocaridina rubra TaxID=373956 RepID=A0AAN9A8K3_HALRR